MTNFDNTTKAGKIETRATPKGVKFFAYNHEQQKRLHIGTLRGECYEKGGVSILHIPEASICLSQSEFGAVTDNHAETLRCITREGVPYTITTALFDQVKQGYYNPGYGPQWRVALSFFDVAGRPARRGKLRKTQSQPIQMSLFDRPDGYARGL